MNKFYGGAAMFSSNDCFTMPVVPAGYAGGYNNAGNGAWGDGGWLWIIVVFALLFGWGNNGFGNGLGGNAGAAWANGALTRADLCQDMNFNNLESAVRGVNQGLCDGFYAMNTSLLNGFNGVDNAICSLGYQTQQGFNSTNIALMQGQNALQTQLSDCCCATQRAIDGVNYNAATNTCNIINTLNNNTRDIIDSQQAGTRAILDRMCQQEIAAKDATIAAQNQQIFQLQLASSQANQNAAIGAMIDASEANIIRRTGNDCPIPAYVVPNPNCCYGQYGAYQQNGCGCNNGCC